jgi:hypothetical protein
MSNVFPESYGELEVLAHHGASDDELKRREAEREAMSLEERFHADLAARSHVGPMLDDHRARWGSREPESPKAEPDTEPSPTGDDKDADESTSDGDDQVPEGTAADVLAWVGTDQDRARRALAVEQAQDRPRSVLIGNLRKLADG